MKKFTFPLMLIGTSLLLSGCFPSGIQGDTAKTSGIGNNLTMSTEWKDSDIKSKVFNVMNHMPALNSGQSDVEVSVYNRQILLVGDIQNAQVHHELLDNLAKIKGVSKIYDYLHVGPRISKSAYSKDGWITSKISASFVGNVNPLHFKVVTEAGVVYLFGVTTKAEGAHAIKLASDVSGVKKVVPLLTYIPAAKK